jgi:hypothetical protein
MDMNQQILNKCCVSILAIFFCLSGCQNTSSNLRTDLNSYNVPLYLSDYIPQIDTSKYQQFIGTKMCMSNIRNDAAKTTNFNYFSNDIKIRYELSNKANTLIQLIPSFFWYAYQKAFIQAGIDTSAYCSPENIPELWIIFQSFTDEELQLKITLLKNRETQYEKDLVVRMVPAATSDITELQKRAYGMIDLTVTTILDDPGLQTALLIKPEQQ